MDVFQRVQSYCNYRLHAKSHQRIHSPFVFNLLKDVFYSESTGYDFSSIEKRRHELLHLDQTIDVTDLGAGADKWKTSQRKISDIAKNSLKRKKYAQLIYKLVHHFQPKTTLELGTSLGITSSYIGQGHPNGQVVTIEGCPNIAAVAQETFATTQTSNIESHIGNFDAVLNKVFADYPVLDFVFIDGNHAYAPTIKYFEECLKYSNSYTVFLFDDIHWSSDMEKAWSEIKNHPKVTITIDIYEMGLVFLRNEIKEAEHFIVKY
ncbi:MAG TPA: class I SAM-dependent methyltransferase [Chitinophagales bacterium]|nr:class I SAM-dependent methyltransferase [Chitinophagales bacterium]